MQVFFWLFWNKFCIASIWMLCYNKATAREGPAPNAIPVMTYEKEDEMDILTTLMQLFGGCGAGQAAQAVTPAAEAASALGGVSGLMGLLCKLFGIGC